MERRPIQYASGSLAAAAFVAVTQILTGVALDLPLWIALAAFASTIPFQIVLFYAPLPPPRVKDLSLPQAVYWHIQSWSTRGILIGFVALFWHFSWWLGAIFAIASYAAFKAYHFWATSPDYEALDAQEKVTRTV